MNFVVDNSGLPMLCTGDMNELMHASKKSGPGRPDRNRMDAFCNYVKQCGFVDLGLYLVQQKTWLLSQKKKTKDMAPPLLLNGLTVPLLMLIGVMLTLILLFIIYL
jgi:hypothetical protein